MSDHVQQPPVYQCIRCREDRVGSPRLKTIAGPVCDACEWLAEMRQSDGRVDPKFAAIRRIPR